MKPRSSATRIAAFLMIASMAASAWTARSLERLRGAASLEEVLYIQSPRLIRFISLGYSGLAADIYWTRAVQYYGGKRQDELVNFDLLGPLLNLTTDLDPHLAIAYEFGSIFLSQAPPQGAGKPDEAVKLVEKGIVQNPERSLLFFNLGYIHYIDRKDYKAAAEAFERGSRVPGAHPSLKLLATAISLHGADTQTARYIWTRLYQTSENQLVRENAKKRLIALRVDDEVAQLENILQHYHQATGEYPSKWQQILSAGYLRAVPRDPDGAQYKLMPNGKVEVQDPAKFPFIEKGLPNGYKVPLARSE